MTHDSKYSGPKAEMIIVSEEGGPRNKELWKLDPAEYVKAHPTNKIHKMRYTIQTLT